MLRNLQYNDDCLFVLSLYEKAFPDNERRDSVKWLELMEEANQMHTYIVETDKHFSAGFITFWDFDAFIYIEHFAIMDKIRGKGIGRRAFQDFFYICSPRPLILEVEPEDFSDQAAKRLSFYKKAGMHIVDHPYMQPPYRGGDLPIPMCLMSSDKIFGETQFEFINNTLQRNVYQMEDV